MFQMTSYSNNFQVNLICNSYMTSEPAVKESIYADEYPLIWSGKSVSVSEC